MTEADKEFWLNEAEQWFLTIGEDETCFIVSREQTMWLCLFQWEGMTEYSNI